MKARRHLKDTIFIGLALSIVGCFVWLVYSGFTSNYYRAVKTYNSIAEVTVNRSIENIIYYNAYSKTECVTPEECAPDEYNVFIICDQLEPICLDKVTIAIATVDKSVVEYLKVAGFNIRKFGWYSTPCGVTGEDTRYTETFSFMGIGAIKSICGLIGILIVIISVIRYYNGNG